MAGSVLSNICTNSPRSPGLGWRGMPEYCSGLCIFRYDSSCTFHLNSTMYNSQSLHRGTKQSRGVRFPDCQLTMQASLIKIQDSVKKAATMSGKSLGQAGEYDNVHVHRK
jgi:hypothetical protein